MMKSFLISVLASVSVLVTMILISVSHSPPVSISDQVVSPVIQQDTEARALAGSLNKYKSLRARTLPSASSKPDVTTAEKPLSNIPYVAPAAPVITPVNDAPVASSEPLSNTPQQIAWNLLNPVGRSAQFSCLNDIINAESSWRVTAENPSGAYGIPQALPGSKMSVAGPDWETSAYTQLFWMIRIYIPGSYGTPCSAWAFHLAHGWY
jgi:hypothetical protein